MASGYTIKNDRTREVEVTDGMNSEQIERVFGALGRIESKLDAHVSTVENHVHRDEEIHKLLFSRVENLQLAHARQKGFIAALTAVGTAIGGGIGYLVQRWLGHT